MGIYYSPVDLTVKFPTSSHNPPSTQQSLLRQASHNPTTLILNTLPTDEYLISKNFLHRGRGLRHSCYTYKRRNCRKRRNLGWTNVTQPQTSQSRVDKRHTTH